GTAVGGRRGPTHPPAVGACGARGAPAQLSARHPPHRGHRPRRAHGRCRRHRPRGAHRANPPAPGRMVHPGDGPRHPPHRPGRGPRPMTTPRTVLLAPDKLKGTLSAAQVVEALRRGITQTAPQLRVLSCPIADGGDGTVDAALAAGFTAHTAPVTGPTAAPRTARWALQEDVAVLELAATVGLHALPGGELAPHTASTRGLGELLRAAVDVGARTLVVGLGGSASTDAGAGLLQGLGALLRTADGTDIAPGLSGLATLASADLEPALAALDGLTLIAANDVTNPLLGSEGAAAVYGPQKGLAPEEVDAAD